MKVLPGESRAFFAFIYQPVTKPKYRCNEQAKKYPTRFFRAGYNFKY